MKGGKLWGKYADAIVDAITPNGHAAGAGAVGFSTERRVLLHGLH